MRKRTLRAQLEEARVQLGVAYAQRDALLEHTSRQGNVPPGTWGPVGRYLVLGTIHLAAGDTLTVEKEVDSIDTERFSSDLQRSYAKRVIDAAVKEQTKDIRERLERLKADLIKMLPRSSNTMSAMRQRDITDFVIERIDLILSVTDGTQETDPE
jgi:hypothetical protein